MANRSRFGTRSTSWSSSHVSTVFSLVGRIFVRCCETFFLHGRAIRYQKKKQISFVIRWTLGENRNGRNRTVALFSFFIVTKWMMSVACVKLVPRDRLMCRDLYPSSHLFFVVCRGLRNTFHSSPLTFSSISLSVSLSLSLSLYFQTLLSIDRLNVPLSLVSIVFLFGHSASFPPHCQTDFVLASCCWALFQLFSIENTVSLFYRYLALFFLFGWLAPFTKREHPTRI